MIQDLLQGKNTEIANLSGTVRTLTDQLELLRTTLETFKSVNGVQKIIEEREQLKQEVQRYSGGSNPVVQQMTGTDEQRYLKSQIQHFEKLVNKLEKERTEI